MATSHENEGTVDQAVILAGGRGTRLLPLTSNVPKPMIAFHGRPFLEYLIEMLAAQGIRKVLLLLGYLPDKIRDYFGDGRRYGIDIEYNISDVDHNTGRRIMLARDRIDAEFLLMYCDNYWPLQLPRTVAAWRETGCRAQVVVYSNDDGYTKDNLLIDDGGLLKLYDKSRTTPNLAGVDIGFLLLDRGVLDELPSDIDFSLEAVLYPKLIEKRELAAYLTYHRYYSVGDHKRLPLTDAFLSRPEVCIVENWSKKFRELATGQKIILLKNTDSSLPDNVIEVDPSVFETRDSFKYHGNVLNHLQRLHHLDLTRTTGYFETAELREAGLELAMLLR